MTAAGKIPVLDIDVQGGLQVIDIFGDQLVSVFLFPPSWAELERRLTSRGTDAAEVIRRRLANARGEVARADHYRYWLVNDDLEQAVVRMQAILVAEQCRPRPSARRRSERNRGLRFRQNRLLLIGC